MFVPNEFPPPPESPGYGPNQPPRLDTNTLPVASMTEGWFGLFTSGGAGSSLTLLLLQRPQIRSLASSQRAQAVHVTHIPSGLHMGSCIVKPRKVRPQTTGAPATHRKQVGKPQRSKAATCSSRQRAYLSRYAWGGESTSRRHQHDSSLSCTHNPCHILVGTCGWTDNGRDGLIGMEMMGWRLGREAVGFWIG